MKDHVTEKKIQLTWQLKNENSNSNLIILSGSVTQGHEFGKRRFWMCALYLATLAQRKERGSYKKYSDKDIQVNMVPLLLFGNSVEIIQTWTRALPDQWGRSIEKSCKYL